jgi:phosphoribosylanthranilate isomerase
MASNSSKNQSIGRAAPHRTRVKICGITREEDLHAAVHAGVDAVGFVLYAHSPRCVSSTRAVQLAAQLPPFVTPVFLFVNETIEKIRALHALCARAAVQLHGDEGAQYCADLGLPHLRALRVSDADLVAVTQANDDRLLQSMQAFSAASAYLLDTHVAAYGGSGKSFDWTKFNWTSIQNHAKAALVLGGGLSPANVAEAIHLVRPWAVDVSSGVERAKGIKDDIKIHAFMSAVRNADAARAVHWPSP